MSQKEAPRPGLVRAAEQGKISSAEGALGLSIRQFRRLRTMEKITMSGDLVRRLRKEAGLPATRKRRAPKHRRREREAREGALSRVANLDYYRVA